MTIDKAKLSWNLNTLLQIATIIGMFAGGITIWVEKSRDIEDLQQWKIAHEQTNRERLAEIKEREGKIDATISNLSVDLNSQSKKVDNLEYRVAVSEASMSTMAAAQKDLQDSVSDMKGDLKVIREIVTRMDASSKRAGR